MPRLLVISPHFPPASAPDMHRVRMSLPTFVEKGWRVTVLTVAPEDQTVPLDPALRATVPPQVEVVTCRALPARLTGRVGLRNLGWRAFAGLKAAGDALLRGGAFDLVYFSTTQWACFPLGRTWQRRFGIPYVFDWQDPWFTRYYDGPAAPRPPGGWKYRMARCQARFLEGWSLRRASGVISVSPDYVDDLRARYPWFGEIPSVVLPFGFAADDFQRARSLGQRTQDISAPGARIVYAGAVTSGMRPALDHLFSAAAASLQSGTELDLCFLGTTYASGGVRSQLADLAHRHGLVGRVNEEATRLPYFDALRAQMEAELTLVLGSDDTGYSPSKLATVLAGEKPVLVLAPANSALARRAAAWGGAWLVTFTGEHDTAAIIAIKAVLAGLTAGSAAPPRPPLHRERLEEEASASSVALAQLAFFEKAIAAGLRPG